MLPLEAHQGAIACISFSPDGNLLLTGSADHSLRVWEAHTGKLLRRLDGHHGAVMACAFLPDGRRVISGGERGELLINDLIDGGLRRLADWGDAADDISSLAVQQNGAEVLLGTTFGWVIARSVADGNEVFRSGALSCTNTSCRIWTTGYLTGGRRFAGNEVSGGIVFKSANEPEKAYPVNVTSGVILAGDALALGGAAKIVWEEKDGGTSSLKLGDHRLLSLDVTQDRGFILAGNAAGDATLLPTADGTPACRLPWLGGIVSVKFAPDGERYAAAGHHGFVIGRTKECVETKRAEPAHLALGSDPVSAVAASVNVFTGTHEGCVLKWDLDTMRAIRRDCEHTGPIYSLTATPHGNWISIGDRGGVNAILQPGSEPITVNVRPIGAALVDGGDSLILLSADNELEEMSLASESLTTPCNGAFRAVATKSYGAEALVGGAFDGLLRRTLTEEGKSTWSAWVNFEPSERGVSALAYSDNGVLLAEGHDDGAVVIRDATTGKAVARLEGLHDLVRGLGFTETDVWAVTASGCMMNWPLSSPLKPQAPPRCEPIAVQGVAALAAHSGMAVALHDGSAQIRVLPRGEPHSILLPLEEPEWLSMRGDHYEASSSKLGIFFESKDGQIRRLDGVTLEPRVSFSATSLGPTAGDIRGTIFSPFGKPKIILDDRWPVENMVVSATQPFSYDVHFVLQDDTGDEHSLEIFPTGLPALGLTFPLDFHTKRARALVIGNELYGAGVPAALGATKDADSFAEALRGKTSWGLPEDRVTVLKNAGFSKMSAAVESFLRDAPLGETLLIYFAGHGARLQTNDGLDGALLPTDYDPAHPELTLRASELWKKISASKASNVLLVLDACRAGAFAFPAGSLPEANNLGDHRVGVLAASNSNGVSQSTAVGGAFTQDLVKLMKSPPPSGLTVGAVPGGLSTSLAQPHAYLDLNALPLAWAALESGPTTKATQSGGETAADWGGVTLQVTQARQISLEEKALRSSAAGRSLVMKFFFGHDTERLRLRVTYPEANREPPDVLKLEMFSNGGKAGSSQEVVLPLEGEAFRGKGEYKVTVQVCNSKVDDRSTEAEKKAACEGAPAQVYKFEL